eukprot:gnl/TRDRNA2_/TRDRNA2_109524_c0_seq1.p1 gnl/TRDRNA2_/TRDRNA2_109524_c0~~gnl/TRDRNA2_/TRDRNA2_109524_c0_seq1.p1  ORF type:complete len:352 (+),score=42.27 gnl/TRDRNA2_/TRDRNA2_109524_c0_seq1:65-1057(+)
MRAAAPGGMASYCAENGIKILAFGVVAGGFLTDKYLGQPKPPEDSIKDWSRMKYGRFVEVIGGWQVLQSILNVLHRCAIKHGVSIANVATRFVLQQQAVAAVIIGVRLGENEHIKENMRVFSFKLDEADLTAIGEVLKAMPASVPGDCGDEYRRPPFLTASGDLSHHLSTLPLVFPVKRDEGPLLRHHCSSGTSWEKIAGFSRATRHGTRIEVSGTTATHTDGTAVGGDDAGAQTTYAVDKAIAALTSLGGTRKDVVRTRLYVPHLGRDWEAVARAHGIAFWDVKPANTLVGAQLVGEEYLVEVEIEAEVQEVNLDYEHEDGRPSKVRRT